jgi:hypothetical protein
MQVSLFLPLSTEHTASNCMRQQSGSESGVGRTHAVQTVTAMKEKMSCVGILGQVEGWHWSFSGSHLRFCLKHQQNTVKTLISGHCAWNSLLFYLSQWISDFNAHGITDVCHLKCKTPSPLPKLPAQWARIQLRWFYLAYVGLKQTVWRPWRNTELK